MNNRNFNDEYKYDSCTSRGQCSLNPKTTALQEITLTRLKTASYYALKLYDNNDLDNNAKIIILNTISIMVSNPEFTEANFLLIMEHLNRVIPYLIKKYKTICENNNIKQDLLDNDEDFAKNIDVIKAIQLGEKRYFEKIKSIPQNIVNLYKTLFVIAKSICISIMDIETYGQHFDEGYLKILLILNNLNKKIYDENALKELVFDVVNTDNKLMRILNQVKIQRYGEPFGTEVSYSTTKGKAILVVGSNIRELEDVLEATKNEEIDVYTHDEMMMAHSFPKFAEYKNLKGQYGQGISGCLLDFSTFPGPIVLTRHSLFNVEHLYRGILYTTDFVAPKGVIQIKDKNFDALIESAKNSRGFKNGKKCEAVQIGFNRNEVLLNIKQKLDSNLYKRIFVIGLSDFSIEQNTYFGQLLKQLPDDVLVVTLSYTHASDNILYLPACFDAFAITEIIEALQKITKLPLTIFFPKCDRHTISQMIYLSKDYKSNIFVGKCTPIILNPKLILTYKEVFGINLISTVKEDLEYILQNG